MNFIAIELETYTETSETRLLDELGLDVEARPVTMFIPLSAIKMWCESPEGNTELWMLGDEISMPLNVKIDDFNEQIANAIER